MRGVRLDERVGKPYLRAVEKPERVMGAWVWARAAFLVRISFFLILVRSLRSGQDNARVWWLLGRLSRVQLMQMFLSCDVHCLYVC